LGSGYSINNEKESENGWKTFLTLAVVELVLVSVRMDLCVLLPGQNISRNKTLSLILEREAPNCTLPVYITISVT